MSTELMKITGYTNKSFTDKVAGPPYKVMINPESLKWGRKVSYNKRQAINSSSTSQKYKHTPSDNLSFDLIIDCTGVVDSKRVDLMKEIKRLEYIVYTYNGVIHRPNFVKIQWGSDIVFESVLKAFDVEYTLYKPDGTPLRAKVSLAFERYISTKKRKKRDKRSSPDMTHLVEVQEGESLPQLCNRIWNTPFYYVQVAKHNKLNKFRNLKGGQTLLFPPVTNPN
jgi:hypothetical protein